MSGSRTPNAAQKRDDSFGSLLRRLREAAGLTQEELASRAGLSVKAVGVLERGERRRPYPHTLRALADALGLSAQERARLVEAVPERGNPPTTDPAPARGGRLGLPGHLDPLIGRGREAEVALLLLLRPDVRLLTLTGPGGVGKTRLALRVAQDARDEFSDGVAFVPLAPLGDPSLVANAVAQTLGAREASGPHPLKNLVATLRDRRLLLVLDNFEHVLEAAPSVAELLLGCPGLKVLVTSRAPLRVHGEQEYRVPPLEFPSPTQAANAGTAITDDLAGSPAVRLFVSRAQSALPDFSLTPENAGQVVRICARLNGIPLAIELAAARLTLLPPRELLDRLERSLQVLTGGGRDLPERQRTMRDAIAWSHDLLDAEERTLFRRLAVFSGGTLGAIEAVCGDEYDQGVIDRLASLVNYSLVHRETTNGENGPRIGLLEPVRQYAQERLEASGEAERFLRRHAEHYHALAAEAGARLMGRDQVGWLDRLRREQYNLLAAVRFFLDLGNAERAVGLTWALWRYWWVTGLQRESRGWMEEVLAQDASDGNLSSLRRAHALLLVGTMAWSQGDDGAALPALEEGLRLCRVAQEVRGQAIALLILGVLDVAKQNGSLARERLEESRRLFGAEEEKWGEALAVGYLGLVHLQEGEYEHATPRFEESLALALAAGDQVAAHQALYNLGLLALAREDHARAAEHLYEGLTLAAEIQDVVNGGYFLRGLGQAAGLAGRTADAVRLLGASETTLRATGSSTYRYIPDQPLHERVLIATREELGATAFEEALAAGQAMTFEQAVAFALDEAPTTPRHVHRLPHE